MSQLIFDIVNWFYEEKKSKGAKISNHELNKRNYYDVQDFYFADTPKGGGDNDVLFILGIIINLQNSQLHRDMDYQQGNDRRAAEASSINRGLKEFPQF